MKKFIVIKAKVPVGMCVYFHPDGSKTVHCGGEIERELVIHIRDKSTEQQKETCDE